MQKKKESFYCYGDQYQNRQADKYRNRHTNHWQHRINLAFELVENHIDKQLFKTKQKKKVVVDIGCSIGTFAIEFAKLGYKTYGIDFDSSALEIAEKLSKEEKTDVIFINNDISNWGSLSLPKIDIAVCFDIFEHLHDDELGALLVSLRNQMSENGKLIFHTFPTEYDYLFYYNKSITHLIPSFFRRLPLYLLRKLPEDKFERFVMAYAGFFDLLYIIKKGCSHRDSIANTKHCNPLTRKRTEAILKRAGYDIVYIRTAQLYSFDDKIQRQFLHQPISHRNLFGVAEKN